MAATFVMTHPVGSRLAATYGISYTDVMTWFCREHMGFGQIMLAATAAKYIGENPGETPGLTYDEMLQARLDGQGWGQIWRDLGYHGRPRDNGLIQDQGQGQGHNQDPDPDDAADTAGPSVSLPVEHGRPADKGLPPGQDRSEGNGPPGLTNHPVHPNNGGGHGKP